MTGETILVVEDEGLIALHLTETLEKAGYKIIDPAYSGEMALHALEKSPKPDLILMDIGLPGSLDGIETVRQIRQKYEIPVIFLSAYSHILRIEEAKGISRCGYISNRTWRKIS